MMNKKLLILGSTGLVGSRVVELLSADFELITPSSSEIDLSIAGNFEKYVTDSANKLIDENLTIINFVAATDVDGAEKEAGDESGLTFRLNAQVPGEIAEWCEDLGHRFIHFSTDYVFDGEKETSPYVEEDKPNPLGWYGKTKLQGDQWVLESIEKGANCVILRIMMPYGSRSEKKKDLGRILLERLQNGQPIQAINNAKITPVFVDDLADVIKRVLENDELKGLYNVAPSGSTTLFEFVKLMAEKSGLETSNVGEISFEDYWRERVANGAAKRPKNSWLDSNKLSKELGIEFKSIEENVEEWLNQIQSNERS